MTDDLWNEDAAGDTPDPAPVKADPRPVPKVAAAGIGGAIAAVLVWIAHVSGLDMPPEVAAAFATIVSFGAGYLQPPRGTDPARPVGDDGFTGDSLVWTVVGILAAIALVLWIAGQI